MKTDNEKIIQDIFNEVVRAEKKHPTWPTSHTVQAAIVCEESGELIRAALQHDYEGGGKDEIYNEAIQTAAMCIRLIQNLY